jgi:hypothetical protein
MHLESYIYYPWIRIPDDQLVYSLLYQDRIKRILPEVHSAEDQTAFHEHENVIRQYLGYDFIEHADFYTNREVVANAFSELILDAHSSRYKEKFSRLFGPGFEERFFIRNRTKIAGTFYFMYPDKLGRRAFETLLKLGWMKHDEKTERCEVEPELLAVYMTALASGAALAEEEQSIFTDVRRCEDVLRNSAFRDYFNAVLPEAYQEDHDLEEFCINFLFGAGNPLLNAKDERIPLHRLLSVRQASGIRAGLEGERTAFVELVQREIAKAQLVMKGEPREFLIHALKDLQDGAVEYREKLHAAVNDNLTAQQKSRGNKWTAVLSLVFRTVGSAIDKALAPGKFAADLAVSALALSNGVASETAEPKAISARTKANTFLNRLWDIQARRLHPKKQSELLM